MMNKRLPAMTGVECPRPGIATFHRTPLAPDHRDGASPTAMPVPTGPRFNMLAIGTLEQSSFCKSGRRFRLEPWGSRG